MEEQNRMQQKRKTNRMIRDKKRRSKSGSRSRRKRSRLRRG